MSEPILTEDEKSALLEGVSSGAVEVHSRGGTRYKSVRPYDLAARARIMTHGYPRLQALDRQLAEALADDLGATLNCELGLKATGLDVRRWGERRRAANAPAVSFLFTAAPLEGNGMLAVDATLVRHLVEAFFGSAGIGSSVAGGALTRGERSVAARFCDAVLAGLADTWRPLMEISPQRAPHEVSLELVDLARETDPVIASEFEVSFGPAHGTFRVLWPRHVLAPLLPAFQGSRRERDAAADRQWQQAIRNRLADVPIPLTSVIGEARHAVGELASLGEGGVLDIANPRAARLFAGGMPILEGHFGVLGARAAFEAVRWLPGEPHAKHSREETRHGE